MILVAVELGRKTDELKLEAADIVLRWLLLIADLIFVNCPLISDHRTNWDHVAYLIA